MEPAKVSKKMLKRLPVYLAYLKELPEEVTHISATSLAKALGLGHVQVRKDLAKISGGGRRRTGHLKEKLIQDIGQFLDYSSVTYTVLVGAGKLGQALLDYTGFEASGLNILAGFDIHPTASRTDSGKPIYPMTRLESFCKCHDVPIGIIAVPADAAQEVCDQMISCGIRAIWNFAPVRLRVPGNVVVQSENLAISLTALRMQLRSREKLEDVSSDAAG